MRILEAEGLVKVRRGNRGGAVVHLPTAGNVAYSLSMVLAMSGADINDVGTALMEVEPLCTALCAAREDRATEVIPVLRELHEQSLTSVDDIVAATTLSRQLHEMIVNLCGNQSLIILVGALEALWSIHVTSWVSQRADPRDVPPDERAEALAVHGQIIKFIEVGDPAAARVLSASHLRDVQPYPQDPSDPHAPLNPALARDRLFFS